jgi:outer membrane protein assembly factor BamB
MKVPIRKTITGTVTAILLIALVLLLACPSNPTSTSTPTTPTTPTTPAPTPPSNAIPSEFTQYAKDWPMANHDYSNTRATTDSTINSDNVNTLGVAWSMPIRNSGAAFGDAASIPVIQGNMVYFQDLGLNMYALELDTGRVIWQHLYNTPDSGPNGPVVAYGKVFIPRDPYSVTALDASNGDELWTQKISVNPGTGIDIQPAVYDNMVLVSTVPGINANVFYAGGTYGTYYALDQNTGKEIWHWDTVDNPGSMWGNPQVNSGGGSWFPPAVDINDGMLYWGVANPAPLGGTKEFPNGTSRPGPNLYTNALVKIDPSDGSLLWFNQVWPHDINDYDLQQSPILATATYNNKQQDVVIAAGKMGRVYMFNRETGALLWQCSVGTHQNDLYIEHIVPPGQQYQEVLPGILGGVETPLAYADGVVYVPANNLPTQWTLPAGETTNFFGGTGNLVAIDINYGRWKWNADLSAPVYGGATVVNDLVFTATYDGTIYAFNKNTGEQVWTYKAPAGIIAWPAVAGDTIIWPCGTGGAPSLIALKLGASAPGLEVARPIDGSTVPAGDINTSVAAFNFTLVDKLGQPAVQGEGHLHYFLDYEAPTTQGQPAIPPADSNVTWAATADATHTFSNVAAGEHYISVELVNNDHTPLNPAVVQKVSFTAQANVPSVQITEPTSGSSPLPGTITVTVKLTNFTLTTGTGEPNAPNQGKLIFYLNDAVPDVPGQDATTPNSITSSGTSQTFQIADGVNVIDVQLVNNDLTTLDIPALAESIVFVNVYGGIGTQ